MNKQLNIKAYELLLQIEVGIREFFISLIKAQGVGNWTTEFLGSIQRETINEVAKRVASSQKNNEQANAQDIYRLKVEKAIKTNSDKTFADSHLFHPFYYLNWTDMENLIRLKQNTAIFEASIGKTGKEMIISSLLGLNGIRNDIAHSRYITEKQYTVLKSSFDQIKGLIDNFDQYVANQSKEENFDSLITELASCIDLLTQKKLLDDNEISTIQLSINNCLNSFWINSLYPDLTADIQKLKPFLLKYKEIRKSIGSVWLIEKMINEQSVFLNNLTKAMKNGKV